MSSYNPRDLSISIRCVQKPQHVYNGGPAGSTFPGWFLEVCENEGYTRIASKQLTPSEVEMVAAALDAILNAGTAARRDVLSAVQRCDAAMRDELQRQLDAARAAAARIPDLERRLGGV